MLIRLVSVNNMRKHFFFNGVVKVWSVSSVNSFNIYLDTSVVVVVVDLC